MGTGRNAGSIHVRDAGPWNAGWRPGLDSKRIAPCAIGARELRERARGAAAFLGLAPGTVGSWRHLVIGRKGHLTARPSVAHRLEGHAPGGGRHELEAGEGVLR